MLLPKLAARRGAAAIIALALLAGGASSACEAKDRAVDCAKLAITVARAADELERAALTSALDENPDQFTDAVKEDAEKIRDRASSVEIEAAANSVLEAVENVRSSLNSGEKLDLSPLAGATRELTEVCPSG